VQTHAGQLQRQPEEFLLIGAVIEDSHREVVRACHGAPAASLDGRRISSRETRLYCHPR
jgi:hypothetical protein